LTHIVEGRRSLHPSDEDLSPGTPACRSCRLECIGSQVHLSCIALVNLSCALLIELFDSDLVVFITDNNRHDYVRIANEARLLVDTRNAINEIESANFFRFKTSIDRIARSQPC
jgi:hypothetical protein